MQVINYFDSDRKENWLGEIARSDWRAGTFLHKLLAEGTIFDATGAHTRVLLLTDGDELVSFCTYADRDDIQPTDLTPWMGFVYTHPDYRGRRLMGRLIAREK